MPEELRELLSECDEDLARLVAAMHRAPRYARPSLYLREIDQLLELRLMITEAHE